MTGREESPGIIIVIWIVGPIVGGKFIFSDGDGANANARPVRARVVAP